MTYITRILRVFPRRTHHTPTDDRVAIGEPGLWIPPRIDEVHISCIFTWDVERAHQLAAAWEHHFPGAVRVGGPAMDSPCDIFVPGRYVRTGITYTSRGCDNHCPWCLVPDWEGPCRPLARIAAGHIVQDNNLLQTPKAHRRKVYQMLAQQKQAVKFQGGLEAKRLTAWDADQINKLHLGQDSLWFAYDSPGARRPLAKALERFRHLPQRWKRVYVLMGFSADDTPEAAEIRCIEIMDRGAIPFAQLYRGPNERRKRRWDPVWRTVSRRWSRPAASLAAYHQGFRPKNADQPTSSAPLYGEGKTKKEKARTQNRLYDH